MFAVLALSIYEFDTTNLTHLGWRNFLPLFVNPLKFSSVAWSRFQVLPRVSAAFDVSSTLTRHSVSAEKHLHSMMQPPPCISVGMVLNKGRAVPGFLRTLMFRTQANPSILSVVLSERRILFLTASESLCCFCCTLAAKTNVQSLIMLFFYLCSWRLLSTLFRQCTKICSVHLNNSPSCVIFSHYYLHFIHLSAAVKSGLVYIALFSLFHWNSV